MKVHITRHSNTKLIIIDTLQKIRGNMGDKFSYANDYEIVTGLKHFTKGKGSLGHNSREFTTENINPERTKFNTCYIREDIQKVYHTLFDVALEEHNKKQKRNDRKIPDYYEKIRTSKQEKLFYEIVVQVGNYEDMSTTDRNRKIAEQILNKYMADFQKLYPLCVLCSFTYE